MWQSLYLYSNETDTTNTQAYISQALSTTITAAGYTPYDPFGPTPGKAYTHALRLFVMPPFEVEEKTGHWLRIISESGLPMPVVTAFSGALATHTLCLSLALDGAAATITAYHAGEIAPTTAALTPHLHEGKTPIDLENALTVQVSAAEIDDNDDAIPFSALPTDVQAMADKLNPKQINKLFNKWMGRVSKHMGADKPDGQSARDLLQGHAPQWHSIGGVRLRALVACLTLPEPGWRVPDFTALRDAYQLHQRRQHKPDARLYPGDAESMQTVPDALRYVPVYGGKGA